MLASFWRKKMLPPKFEKCCDICFLEIVLLYKLFRLSFFVKFGLSEKQTKFEKNLPHGFDKSADLLKGQLNSEKIYEVIVSPKCQPNIWRISVLPSKLPGQKSSKCLVGILGEQWTHKFILNLNVLIILINGPFSTKYFEWRISKAVKINLICPKEPNVEIYLCFYL